MSCITAAAGIIYEGEFFNDMRDGCGCMWAKSGTVIEHARASTCDQLIPLFRSKVD